MILDVPRISETKKDSLTNEKNSSVIFNTTKSRYEFYDGNSWSPFNFSFESGEPTGFPINGNGEIDRTSSVISFDNLTRTFKIEPNMPSISSFSFMVKGKLFKKTTSQTVTIDSANAEGIWFFYFDENAVLQKTNTFSNDLILKHCYIAYIYWDEDSDTVIHFGDERHGMNMDSHTHIWMHATHGAAYISGIGLSNFNFNSGNLATDIQFSVGSGFIRDEDILHTIPQIASTTGLRVLYRLGTGSNWRRGFQSGYSALSYSSGTRIAYNQYTNGAWQLAEISNNNFVCYHIVATNDINYPVMAIMGETEYGSKAEARAGANSEINNLSGLPFYEFRFIGTIIYQTSNSFSNALKAKIVTTDTGANYVDWRFTALQPTTATTNVHNNLGGIDIAPYYHSNQPIKISDDVVFNAITATNSLAIGNYQIFQKTNGLFFNEDLTITNLDFNYVLSSGDSSKNVFLILNKKNTGSSVGIGLNKLIDKDEFILAGKNSSTDFVFLKNIGANFDSSGVQEIARINSSGQLSIKSIDSQNFYITDLGQGYLKSLIIENELTINGNTSINTESLLIKDSVIMINNKNETSAPVRDIGIQFKYYNSLSSISEYGFIGYITDSSIDKNGIKYFTALHNVVNTSDKITGVFSEARFGSLFVNSIYANNNTFSINSIGETNLKSLTINTNYGIDSTGYAILSKANIAGDLTVFGNLNIQGETGTLNIANLSIEDPVLKLNTAVLSSMYINTDIGIEFNYYDTQPRIGFFGIELETDGTIKYFKILKNAINASEKFNGTFGDLRLNNLITNSVTVNSSYGINSDGKGIFNELLVTGNNSLIDTTNFLIKDSVVILNNKNLTSTYNSTDFGFIYKYYDTSAKQAFFGLETNIDGTINSFKILTNISNENKKITGTNANLLVNDITSNSISINDDYGITSTGIATFNSLSVNSKKYRNGSSNILTNGIINLSNDSYIIYNFDQNLYPTTLINLTNGLNGEIVYLKIKSSGTQYSWGSNIKWPSGIEPVASVAGKYDIYSFICFSSNVYYGTFAFDYME